MTLNYYQRDERPFWEATVEVNGEFDDMTSDYTFKVEVFPTVGAEAVLTKTTGIIGGTAGRVTVAWAGDELDLDPATYIVQLTATRVSDDTDWTIQDRLTIKYRAAA